MYGGSYVVNLFNRKLYHKKTIFLLYRENTEQYFLSYRLSGHLHCTNRPVTHVLRKDMFVLSRRSKRTPFKKKVLKEISRKSNLNRTT